jgi:hypothetical protein
MPVLGLGHGSNTRHMVQFTVELTHLNLITCQRQCFNKVTSEVLEVRTTQHIFGETQVGPHRADPVSAMNPWGLRLQSSRSPSSTRREEPGPEGQWGHPQAEAIQRTGRTDGHSDPRGFWGPRLLLVIHNSQECWLEDLQVMCWLRGQLGVSLQGYPRAGELSGLSKSR